MTAVHWSSSNNQFASWAVCDATAVRLVKQAQKSRDLRMLIERKTRSYDVSVKTKIIAATRIHACDFAGTLLNLCMVFVSANLRIAS